jgi:hypothetical protein
MRNDYNNRVTNSGLLTGTGAETVYDTTVTIEFAIDGIAKRKAAVTDGATPTTDGNTGAAFDPVYPDKACLFCWCLDIDGTVSLIQSEISDVDGDTDAIETPIQFPNIPSNKVMFAYTLYQTTGASSASGLRPGTDNWNATGLTATHRNVMEMPSRPVAA